jgi:hypothetical protein
MRCEEFVNTLAGGTMGSPMVRVETDAGMAVAPVSSLA